MMDSLAILEPLKPEIQDVSLLDKAIARVKRHSVTAAKHVYAMGEELRRIRDEDLWMLRLNKKNGRPKYKGFWDWVHAELPMSEGHVRKIMNLNEQFTLADVRKYGRTRLSVAMRLPKKKRKTFLRRVSHVPACSKELRQIARDMLAETDERDYRDLGNHVDLSVPLGIMVLPMWKRNIGDERVGKVTSPAVHLTDDPWTKMKLAHDVTLYVRLSRNTRGELISIIEIREGEDKHPVTDEQLNTGDVVIEFNGDIDDRQ